MYRALSIALALFAPLHADLAAGPFELSEAVQVDQVDSTALAQLERVNGLLADRHWADAVEILCRLAESPDDKLLPVSERCYESLREGCQRRLAALPPEALKLYREQTDSAAEKIYAEGIAQRDRRKLNRIAATMLAGSFGDRALMALGELALESGDSAAARAYWRRILDHCPGSPMEKADIRARLVLASILEGSIERAQSELEALAHLHPDAVGRLGRQRGRYVDLLKSLLDESRHWPAHAGNDRRNRVSLSPVDAGAVAWRFPLEPGAVRDRDPPGVFPLLHGDLMLANDGRRIVALRHGDGQPAWGVAAIYQEEPSAANLPVGAIGSPRYTATVFQNRLYARMGPPVAAMARSEIESGCLVCLDLAAEGRLLWKIEPEPGWSFDGSPAVDRRGVFAAMRRGGIRAQAFAACFDAETGRPRWRRWVCGAETPGRGVLAECSNNQPTLGGDAVYFNTNLGAVAALDPDDGRFRWLSLYPRGLRVDLARLAPHWRRAANPCILDRGALLVAPADSPRVFAFDADGGRLLWQSSAEVDDAIDLLGVAGDWLIAGGERLYWISLKPEDAGRVRRVWPDGSERSGWGRGLLLSATELLWTARDKLYTFDPIAAEPKKTFDLASRGAVGGNLLAADGRLLIAAKNELILLDIQEGLNQK